jgi:hypothetical protein
MGSTPLTTSAELAQTAKTPLDADVGHRITTPGTFDSIASLTPGQSARFRVRLPRRTLPVSSPGVYWFGVHVLGDNGQGGPREAVGRDRTFLAWLPATVDAAPEDVALVVPIRAGVARGPDGTVIDPEDWGQSLRSGALHDATQAGADAGARPLTWLLDPAVPDVVRQLARGNPARTLLAPGATPSSGQTTDETSDGPSSSPSSGASNGSTSAAGTAPSSKTERAAKQWSTSLRGVLAAGADQVLGLPYGDLAVEPAVTYGPALLRSAVRQSAGVLKAGGLTATPAIAPPQGRTTPGTVAALARGTDVLLSDTGVSRAAHTVTSLDGHPVVLTSHAVAEGGPGPAGPHTSLAFRQRLLAEAAVRLIDGSEPLVVELPSALLHHIRPSFFTGLDVPWLHLTTVDGVTTDLAARRPDGQTARLQADQLRPPAAAPRFGARLYQTSQRLLDDGDALQSVLTDNHILERQLFEDVAGNASYAAEQEPYLALARMKVTARWVRQSLDGIDLAAPESVTLASSSGRFSVLVSNALDVPVTVKVRAVADPRVHITGGEKVSLAPHGRASVLLNASTHERGVHTVTLELTNPAGRLLGATDHFPMRAEQVSSLIWVIIGCGVGLLFAAIAVRLTRRILRARGAPRGQS